MLLFKPKFWDKTKISLFSVLLFPIALIIKYFKFCSAFKEEKNNVQKTKIINFLI